MRFHQVMGKEDRSDLPPAVTGLTAGSTALLAFGVYVSGILQHIFLLLYLCPLSPTFALVRSVPVVVGALFLAI